MTTDTTRAEAREFCRRTLPRVSRTFALNIELLSGTLRDAVRVAYLLCRAADTIEDRWGGSPVEIERRFDAFAAALAGDDAAAASLAQAAGGGDRARTPAAGGDRARGDAAGGGGGPEVDDDFDLLAHLPLVLAAYRGLERGDRDAVAEGVRTMAEGMKRYAARAARRGPAVPYVDDEAELHDYCWVVAGCVGAMLTRLHERRAGEEPAERRARRAELAPVVGEALQLTNILLDWPTDVRRGRCYLPAAWLREHGLAPADLAGGAAPAARELALRLEALAHAALDHVADYLETVDGWHVRYRLFCLWPALWARASIRLAHGDPRFPLEGRPKLTRAQLWSVALRSLLVLNSRSGMRRLLAEP